MAVSEGHGRLDRLADDIGDGIDGGGDDDDDGRRMCSSRSAQTWIVADEWCRLVVHPLQLSPGLTSSAALCTSPPKLQLSSLLRAALSDMTRDTLCGSQTENWMLAPSIPCTALRPQTSPSLAVNLPHTSCCIP